MFMTWRAGVDPDMGVGVWRLRFVVRPSQKHGSLDHSAPRFNHNLSAWAWVSSPKPCTLNLNPQHESLEPDLNPKACGLKPPRRTLPLNPSSVQL